MRESRYEKYVVRKPIPPDLSIAWGRNDLGWVAPSHFLSPDGPIKVANTMVEFIWITQDCASGVTPQKSPHKHDCDEIFLFMGTNPEDEEDLGAEVEFWLGEGEETERIMLTTSSLVFIPRGLLHMPIFYRNVKRPSLRIVIGLNTGEALKNTIRYPVRGV
jgi:hypothetical protein